MNYEEYDEDYEDKEEYDEDEEDFFDDDAGDIEYTIRFCGDKNAVKEARDFARGISWLEYCTCGEEWVRFEDKFWDCDNAVDKILNELAVKIAKKYPDIEFEIKGTMWCVSNESNYGPGGVVYNPPTFHCDFKIEYKNKKLTRQMTDVYWDLWDCRDDVVGESWVFEGEGPLSKEALNDLMDRAYDGDSLWVSRGSIYEDEVPLGEPIEVEIDWNGEE